MNFRIFTVGWEPDFIDYLLNPIEQKTSIDFTHGLVGDAWRIHYARKQYPQMKFVTLSKTKNDPLPAPDYELLASLECVGVLTIKSMVQGDRVLRHRPAEEAFSYSTLLARQMYDTFRELQPDLVLGSFDSLHAALSLAVAKSLKIPWVSMAFTVIPDNLTGFCKGLTPNRLVPIERVVDDELRMQAREIIQKVRSKEQKVLAFQPPASLAQWLRQYILYGLNFLRRMQNFGILGIDQFTYTSVGERFFDISRKLFNRLCLPAGSMLNAPPKGRFIYYPFHMVPESMLDTWAPFYQDQLAFVAQLSLSIPGDMTFVVKLHFSDPDNYSRRQLQQLMDRPGLKIANPSASGWAFLEKATIVFGIQGTSCLEAALFGKPVLLFGDSPYQHFPRSERAKRPDEIYQQIQHMVELPPPSDEEIVEAFAAYMARYMPGRINDWQKPVGRGELTRLANCFQALRSYLEVPGNLENWYRQSPFV